MGGVTTNGEFFIEELRRRRKEGRALLEKLAADKAQLEQRMAEATQSLMAVESLLRIEAPDDMAPKASKPLPTTEWDGVALVEATNRVLREAGKPLHVVEILEALRARNYPFTQKNLTATLTTNLVRGLQRGEYLRTAPNTYTMAGSWTAGQIGPTAPGAVIPETIFDQRRMVSE